MDQDIYQLKVHPWREVLLMRATGYPIFITSSLRFTFAIYAIGTRRADYSYPFPYRAPNGSGIFAYPQPVSDERYVDYGLAQFDSQAHAVDSLLCVYMVLSLVDWFPSWVLARYKHNPVWANGWTSRVVILAHALVPAVHLAIAVTCQVLFAALVNNWLSSPRIQDLLDRWEELGRQPWGPDTPLPPDLPPPPPPPPRGDYVSKNPKEVEIDPVVTCVLAFFVLSIIDVFTRWAKLLTLRVVPTSWRFPDSITVCHRPVPSDSPHYLEEDRREWDGPIAAMFQKQHSRRLSFERCTAQTAGTAPQSSGNVTTTLNPPRGHSKPLLSGNVPLAPILLRDGLRIPREYQKLFLHYFVGYIQWEIVLGFSTIELVLNTVYLVLLLRSNRVCNR
ncbi:uncharacterized protein FSUBG_13044 [Fusarium subglutinans]|uniref:Uncharacterized protein n=1 Tax=Gibberella subglutinans TaxID=42677 RepID=A0A8H5P1Z3_GIBSU|nr:uncharacterized protein FSUBG_13044 [Fusarium subglutinans]KAF5583675.1 hypothetical protein FSUBG_13044 [Fusarium subglutinans]